VSQIQNEIAGPVVFTEAAAKRVWELIEEEGNPTLMLRVYITGGGCSGFQYGFTFDETAQADDMVVEKTISIQSDKDEDDGSSGSVGSVCVKLLIDPMSFQYLMGAEIDYKVDLNGEQFIIRNPNAKTTCGCGSSFSA